MMRSLGSWLAQPRSRRVLILAHDIIVVAVAFPIAIALRENFDLGPYQVFPAIYGTVLLLIITPLVWRLMRVQQSMWRYASSDELLTVVKALFVIVALFLLAMFFVDRLNGVSRSVLILFWAIAFAGLCSTRIIYCSMVKAYQRRRLSKQRGTAHRVVIHANLDEASAAIQAFHRVHGFHADLVGIISDDAERGRLLHGVEILGSTRQLKEIFASLEVTGRSPQVIMLGDSRSERDAVQIQELVATDLSLLRSRDIETVQFDHRSHASVLDLAPPGSGRKAYTGMKRLMDVVVASTALFLLSPLLVLIGCVIYLTDGAPVFFVQVRAGKDLREFRLLKFRTMKPPIDKEGRSLADDERITWFGSLLRATRVDEIPQLWNVLKGDMSLVGPRPLLPRDMPKEAHTLAERYCIRPGITGWAQVNGGKKIDNDLKMPLDIYYIRNFSLLFDLKIMIMTVDTVINGEKVNKSAKGASSLDVVSSRM